jgi:hypothetical protein
MQESFKEELFSAEIAKNVSAQTFSGEKFNIFVQNIFTKVFQASHIQSMSLLPKKHAVNQFGSFYRVASS